MASEAQPNHTHQTPPRNPTGSRLPAAISGRIASATTSYLQCCVSLFDWWLVRVEGEEGKVAVAGFTTRNRAARIFTSAPIIKRFADGTLETADGIIVLILGPINIPRMHENGFPHKVSECFLIGFPVDWDKCTNSYMKQATACTGSDKAYAFPGNVNHSVHSVSINHRTNHIFSDSELDGIAKFVSTVVDLGTKDVQTKVQPKETSSFQFGVVEDSEENANRRSHYGKGLGTSKDASLNKGYCRNILQHGASHIGPSVLPAETCNYGQVEEETEIQHENMHRYASEQKMVNHSTDLVSINNCIDHISTDLGDGIPRCGKTSVDLGTEHAKVRTKQTSSQFGVIDGSDDSAIRRLRNGKVFRISNALSKKRSYKKEVQTVPFKGKIAPNEEVYRSLGTHDKAKKFSDCTAESLRPKRTRSGRVFHRVDSGHQNNVDNVDDSVAGTVATEELPSSPEGSKSEPVKRGRRSGRAL